MDVIDAIYARRAVKHFDPSHRLTAEEERQLLEATIQAPTSFNIQHWRFVILRDPALRSTIRKDYGNDQAQITDASLLVLFTADIKAWSKQPERYWAKAPSRWQSCWWAGWALFIRAGSGCNAMRPSARSAWPCRP